MVCIYCSSKLSVSNSRPQKRTNTVWRRRACPNCQAVFTSIEAIDLSMSMMFRSQAKHLEPFSRDKLYISVYEACRHRKTATEDARALTATIIERLRRGSRSAVQNRSRVVSTATDVLQRFDAVAATAYHAYHPL